MNKDSMQMLCSSYSEPMFSLLLGKYLSAGLLGHRVDIFNFIETTCFPKWLSYLMHSPTMNESSDCFTYKHSAVVDGVLLLACLFQFLPF